jgi:dihydrofolate synthase/folylpolyglutamate synthase
VGLADYERMAGRETPLLKLDLGRMKDLASRLGSPQESAPVVHIAGTKGKGSVAAMVSSILLAAGLRSVTFISPHLLTFRERIRLDGVPISEELFVTHLGHVWEAVETMAAESPYGLPSTFEALTAMAFGLAREESADVQVLEVGLGGRLDSTNVANGQVAVITSLSLDHTDILGEELSQIAWEKAGIIKPGAHVVVSPQPDEAEAVVFQACREMGATPLRLGHEVTWSAGRKELAGQEVSVTTPNNQYDIWLPLLGPHQRENAAASIAAVEALDMNIPAEAIIQGIKEVQWPGRFQVINTAPYVVLDGAHNTHSMSRLRETVEEFLPDRRTILIFGCSGDKDLDGMVAQLAPVVDLAVLCQSRHPRSVPTSRLREVFGAAGIRITEASTVAEGFNVAMTQATRQDLVLATGSLFVVGEGLEHWYNMAPEYYPELDPFNRTLAGGSSFEVDSR